MKPRVMLLVFFLLLGVIGYSLMASSLKEGFEAITQWKQTGELPWDGPYSLPETKPVPEEMFMFANNKISPDCNTSTYTSSGGGVCTTPEQLRFLNTRGGNRTIEDGF